MPSLSAGKRRINTPCVSRQGSYVVGWQFRRDHNVSRYRGLRAAPFSEAEDDEVFGERQRDVHLEAPTAGFTAGAPATRVLTTVWQIFRFPHHREAQPTSQTGGGRRAGTKARKNAASPCLFMKTFHSGSYNRNLGSGETAVGKRAGEAVNWLATPVVKTCAVIN